MPDTIELILQKVRLQAADDFPDMRVMGAEISRILSNHCYVEVFLRRPDGEKDVMFYGVDYDGFEVTLLGI